MIRQRRSQAAEATVFVFAFVVVVVEDAVVVAADVFVAVVDVVVVDDAVAVVVVAEIVFCAGATGVVDAAAGAGADSRNVAGVTAGSASMLPPLVP